MIHAEKWTVHGNDFLLFIEPEEKPHISHIVRWCHRQLGIGADGVAFIKILEQNIVEVIHWDPDGSKSFCLNVLGAVLVFLQHKNIFPIKIISHNQHIEIVNNGLLIPQPKVLTMDEETLPLPSHVLNAYAFDVGNPQLVLLLDAPLKDNDTFRHWGQLLRYFKGFSEGINVNFSWQESPGIWYQVTFERGVEDLTLACGTGAIAIAAALPENNLILLPMGGGQLKVEKVEKGYIYYSKPKLIAVLKFPK